MSNVKKISNTEGSYSMLDDFREILPRDTESKINQVKAHGFVITLTTVVEVVIILMFYEHQKKACNNILQMRMQTVLNSLRQHERDSFLLIICRMALVQTQGHSLNRLELSNQLLQRGYGCLKDLNLFGLIDERTEHQPLEYEDSSSNSYTFIHIHVQHFLAAIYLLKSPLMEVFQFLKNYILAEHNPLVISNSSMVLRFFFGLAGIGDNSTELLTVVLKFLSQHINREAPVTDSRVFVLILCCLYEAQTRAESTSYIPLYRQVQNQTFIRQIFSYDARVIEENVEPFAYYLANTTDSKQSAWTIYCSNKQKVAALTKKLNQLKVTVNKKWKTKLTASDSCRVIISNKNYDYLVSTLVDTDTQGSPSTNCFQGRESSSSIASSYPESSMLSLSTVSVDTQYIYPSSANTSDCLAGPYGYLTEEQFKSEKKSHTTFYFNMVKDFVTPNLQMHSATLVHRKNDHVWFSFPLAMRHNFFENVQFSPVIPMHWVKVPQPDGSAELEEKFREKALSQQGAAVPTSQEIAELIVLNSHRVERIATTPPSGRDPVLIPLYHNSELSETKEIGCDYLMQYHPVQEEVKWKKTNMFIVGKDEQIGRELPLPSKKGTESAEITTSTAMANLKETAGISAQQQPQIPSTKLGPREQILGSTKLFARPLGEGPDIHFLEQQIMRWAIKGFDRPGFCFYGDGDLFQMGYEYTLPEQLPHTRTLREGGNGTVLEVYYEGTFYAVKQTAFTWREVLIMPKLKHKNILRLVTMLMGPPMKEYPKRRYVFQYFPRMSNDLGRSIGSYERYCLRTLKERYRNEILLLSRIQENFKYVATEILEALNYLHTLRPSPIVHRDVKPSNVLVKSDCNCANTLVCVCRVRPYIVLSDFDASLELSPDGELIPDSTHSRSQSYYTTHERLFHISPVGTVGFKSPEGFMHIVSNNLEILPKLSTKADIFSFGLLMVLLLLNEDGPRHLSQVGTLLLSMNQTVDNEGRLSQTKIDNLKKNKIVPRLTHFRVIQKDIERVLPIKRLKKDFADMPELKGFIMKALTIDPVQRLSAQELLQDPYLVNKSSSNRITEKQSSYKMNKHGSHGYALIINIIEFDKMEYREGAENDTERLVMLMDNLRYKLFEDKVHVNCTAQQIKNIIKKAMNMDHSDCDSFVCFLSSHGDSEHIYGTDGLSVRIDEVLKEMEGCVSLVEKPKICFIQCCRESRVKLAEQQPKGGDFFVGYATVSSAGAYRSTLNGSFYIKELCKAFEENEYCDLSSIVTKAHRKVKEKSGGKQNSVYFSSLTDQVYFN